jgi:hypothetical protein
MKGQDIVILLKLFCLNEREFVWSSKDETLATDYGSPYSVRNLATSLGISKTEVAASLNRSLDSGLATIDQSFRRTKPNRRDLFNFIVYGLKFVFPAKLGAPERGIPTGFSAPMLQGLIISPSQDVYIWPNAYGMERGLSVVPLFNSVPVAVQSDPELYRLLALIDAIRLGRQREANLAAEQLRERLIKQ